MPESLPEVFPPPRWCGAWGWEVGCCGRVGRLADSRQFAWAVPADVYSQPWVEGGSHLYSAGGRGCSCASLTGRPEGQGHGAERRAQLVSCLASLTAVYGVGHQEEPCFPAGQIVGETLLPSLCFSLHHHLSSHPGAAAGQPLDLSARALVLQLGSWWLPAAYAPYLCISSSLSALFPPPPPISPSGILAGPLNDEAEASGEKQMAALLPLSPD